MNIAIIGAQWGDEGKGKMVDYLASEALIIVRFSGGANAGHTIVRGSEEFRLHLVPSGVLYEDKTVILGTGMAIDPEALFDELAMLKSRGIDWEGRVFLSDRAHLVLPGYREADKNLEAGRKNPIGTTGRGIGITYSMKAARDGIRIADINDPKSIAHLEDDDRAFIGKWRGWLSGLAIDLPEYLYRHRHSYILFEGAQGTLLDLDNGTYPYVSSGISCAAGASVQGGIGLRKLDRIIGVFKAYTTRVGNGPFPTEFTGDSQSSLCKFIRETGREFGVTTGRPRRCGYLDLVALRYACITNSIDSLVLTHLDVYDSLDSFEACVAYRIGGKTIEHFPARMKDLEDAEPVLHSFKGWNSSLKELRDYNELPVRAREYISFIEEYCETEIGIVSVGYERSDTIIRKNPWTRDRH